MAGVFNRGKFNLLSYDMDAITIKAILLTDSFTYDEDDNVVADISANRASGTTDQTLGSLALVEDDTNDIAYEDAADPTFTAVPGGQNISCMVTYRSTGAEATDDLLGHNEATDIPANGGNISCTIPALGFLQLTD